MREQSVFEADTDNHTRHCQGYLQKRETELSSELAVKICPLSKLNFPQITTPNLLAAYNVVVRITSNG
jgi:hypothetical protein